MRRVLNCKQFVNFLWITEWGWNRWEIDTEWGWEIVICLTNSSVQISDRKQGHILKNNLYSDTNYIFQCNILSQTDHCQKQRMTSTLYLAKVLLLTVWRLARKHGLNAQFTAWISGISWEGPGLHRDQKTWVFPAPLVPILTHIFRVSINIFTTSFSHFPGSKHKNFWSLQKISWISFAKNNQKQNM